MIRFSGQDSETGRPVLGIGLTADNCARLLKSEPIFFNTEGAPHVPAIDVFIMGGATEQDIVFDLHQAGALAADQILEDPQVRPADSASDSEVN